MLKLKTTLDNKAIMIVWPNDQAQAPLLSLLGSMSHMEHKLTFQVNPIQSPRCVRRSQPVCNEELACRFN